MLRSGTSIMRHEIYRRAVARLQQRHPEYDAASYLASRLNKSVKAIYSYLCGDAIPSVMDEERLLLICEYPEGFSEKQVFVFNSTSTPTVQRAKR